MIGRGHNDEQLFAIAEERARRQQEHQELIKRLRALLRLARFGVAVNALGAVLRYVQGSARAGVYVLPLVLSFGVAMYCRAKLRAEGHG
jgi:hypothetical protein